MYKEEAVRAVEKSNFSDIDSYIKSLGLEMHIYKNHKNLIQRISQLTNKTNQFNLTTKRYSETDIQNKMDSGKSMVIAVSVKDKFGDFGIIGVAILDIDQDIAYIDTFLLSCRVLGRKIENQFLAECLNMLFNSKVSQVIGIYAPTPKNSQVKNFYLNQGFEIFEDKSDLVSYNFKKENFKYEISSLIKIDYGN